MIKPSLMISAPQTHPAKPAVVARRVSDSSTRILSYTELAQLTERCAVALAELGLQRGDFVAVQLTNKWEIAPLVFGCLRAGVRICPLVPMYRRRELRAMLGLTEARAFITMAELYGEPSGQQAKAETFGLDDSLVMTAATVCTGARQRHLAAPRVHRSHA